MRKIVVKKTVEIKSADLIKTLPFVQRVVAKIFSRRITTDGFVKIEPYNNGLLIDAILDYNNKIIGTQSCSYIFDGSKTSVKDFVDNIAKSRSFGGYAEWEWVKNTTSDSLALIYRLVNDGDGITVFPSWFEESSKNLVCIDNLDFEYEMETQCVCRTEIAESPKVLAFVNFFIDFCKGHNVPIDIYY